MSSTLRYDKSDSSAVLNDSAFVSSIAPTSVITGIVTAVLMLAGVWKIAEDSSSHYRNEVEISTTSGVSRVRATVEMAINRRAYLTLGLSSYVSVNPALTDEDFRAFARMMMQQEEGIRSVTLLPDNVIRSIYPMEGNQAAIGLNIMDIPEQAPAAIQAMETGKSWLEGPVELRQGGEAFIHRAPVTVTSGGDSSEQRYWGLVSILIDREVLLNEIRDNVPPELTVAVRGLTAKSNSGTIVYGDEIPEGSHPIVQDILLPTGTWTVSGIPRGGWPAQSPMADGIRAFGATISVLVSVLVFMVVQSRHRYRRNAEQLRAAHRELQKFSAEMAAARRAAEAANESKSVFLASMSHEIRTPLSAVIGMTELVLDTDLNKSQRDYLAMVRESGESLMTVINDILDFSKIEAGKLEIAAAPFDLHEQLGDMLKPLGIRAAANNTQLTFRVDPAVPSQVSGDAHRLRQILTNLVGNAVKFTEGGNVDVDVEKLDSSRDACRIQFSVTDTGIGIPKEKLSSIFDAFAQAESGTSRQFGGTGLGLAICQRLVTLMGGMIRAESELGAGSTFYFTLPFAVSKPAAGDEIPVEVKNHSVIVISDTCRVQQILSELLRSVEVECEIFDSVTAAASATTASHARDTCAIIADAGDALESMLSALRKVSQENSRLAKVPRVVICRADVAGCSLDEDSISTVLIRQPIKRSELLQALKTTAVDSEGAADVAVSVKTTGLRIRPLRILLAEDDPFNQRLAIALLEKWGHSVELAQSGGEAVECWRANSYDLIIMDVQMPGTDGLEATRQIRELEKGSERHVPIIAMTAHALTGDRERCLEAGMDGYATKPLRIPAVHAEIHRILGDSQLSESTGTEVQSESPAEMTHSELDWDAALESCDGDRELLLELLPVLRNEIPKHVKSIQAAIEADDETAVRTAAHALKGALQIFGPTRTGRSAARIETAAQEGRLSQVQEDLTWLESHAAPLIDELSDVAANGIP